MKKFMRIAFVAAFAAIAGYGVYTNLKTDVMSDLALANVEALARNEVDQIKCNQAMGGTCVLINNTPIQFGCIQREISLSLNINNCLYIGL